MNSYANELASLAVKHQVLIGNTGTLDLNGATGGIYGPPGPQLEIRRPWLDPPEGAQPFDLQSGVALGAVGAGDVVVLTLPVDDGYDGVINFISHNFTGAGFTQFSGDIVWRLFINGKAVRNFSNMTSEKGTVEIPRQISPIRIYSGQIVTYTVNHVANAALNGNVICSVNGYFYPNRGT